MSNPSIPLKQICLTMTSDQVHEDDYESRTERGKSFMDGAERVEIQIRGFHPAFVAREGQPLTSIESEE